MKIIRVTSKVLRCETGTTIGDALSTVSVRQAVLIRIDTDCGISGTGEAFTYGCSAAAMCRVIEDQFAPALIDEDPLRIEWLWQKLFWRSVMHGRHGIAKGAMSGIDIALWDILGQAAGLPVWRLLGGYQPQVKAYASGGFYAPDKNLSDLQREVEGYLQKGYQAVKIKTGRISDHASSPHALMPGMAFALTGREDLARLIAARAVLGDDAELYVDINAAMQAHQVREILPALHEQRVRWVEEPICVDNQASCSQLKAAFPPGMLLAGFETLQGASSFQTLINACAVDIVQPDIGWAGGFSECRRIASVAQAAGLPVSMHSFGSAVHFAASLHMAAAFANSERIESEENANPLRSDLLKIPFNINEHHDYLLDDKPGLGIEIDWDSVNRFVIN